MARLWLSVLLVVSLGALAVALIIARPLAPKGYSGLEFTEMTGAAAARAPLLSNHGALVEQVAEESPAARAGIKAGDVVAAIDGIVIVSARQASDIVRRHGQGDRVAFTLFAEAEGAIHPRKVSITFEASPPSSKTVFRVKPQRLLAREFFHPPVMAANAAWSRKIAHGASVRPRAMPELKGGDCSGVAPEEWIVRDAGAGMIHLVSKDGSAHAIYKLVPLTPSQRADPKGYVLGLAHAIFHSPVMPGPGEHWNFGIESFNFGNGAGIAGLALWRLNGGILSVWIASVPASDVAWAMPVTAATVLSMQCKDRMAPKPQAYARQLPATSVSIDCLKGACEDSDFAAAYLARLRLGYVHDRDGEVFLIDPTRDFWADGQDGAGFYRQLGGEDEKLLPGRTN